MTGKEKCRALREIRGKIAESNGIDFAAETCTHEGPCSGTCAKCEQEAHQLETQLEKRASLGKKIALAGLCAGMIAATAGCALIEDVITPDTVGIVPYQAEVQDGEIVLTGDVPAEAIP